MPAVFRHFVGQALLSVSKSKTVIIQTFS